MATTYRLTPARRLLNRTIRAMLRWNLGPRSTYLLTTTGHRSGQARTTPVTLVEGDDGRWLVAPYGPVAWVANVRATPRVTLRRGTRTLALSARELPAVEAAPILRRYVRQVPVTRPFFDVHPSSSIEEYEREAARHPVFTLE